MKKVFVYATVIAMSFAFNSCEEKTVGDEMEDVGEEMGEAGEAAGDKIEEKTEEVTDN
ncbi:hypothetical protein [Brumimicrobium glaciale]|jgi:hypothetical protein|uniref:hypothetical protein n=1 Tax=Brumimicrobium glaciale TaxID=200475 RepID=UPI0013EB7A6D|nr:hypothetical protein [Brumimicrobium glaciale]